MIFHQDGSPAHYKDVWGYLNRNLPERWIERTGKEDDALMRWPPRSPDLTPCDFFFCRFVKDTVFVPPLPANLQIFATVSPLLWLWSTMICRHAVERDRISYSCLPYYQRLTHWASVKYVKKLGRVSLSIGIRTTMIRWVVYLLKIFKMFYGLMNKPFSNVLSFRILPNWTFICYLTIGTIQCKIQIVAHKKIYIYLWQVCMFGTV